jgi:hypothetical protein
VQNFIPQIGDKIAVKRFGYTHEGIYVGQGAFHGRDVVHNDKGGGVVLTTFAEFSRGSPVYLSKRVTENYFQQQAIANRAFSLIGRKFDLFTFNCEHAANLAQRGRQESPQLQGVLFLLAFMSLVLIAKRA